MGLVSGRMIQRVHRTHVDWYLSPTWEDDRYPTMTASRRGVSVSPAVDPDSLPVEDRAFAAAVARHLAAGATVGAAVLYAARIPVG